MVFCARAWQRLEGYSLLELLIVIAVIGVVAAIAIPQLSDLSDATQDGVDHQNAQLLSAVATGADAVGMPFGDGGQGYGSVVSAIQATVQGAVVTDPQSPFEGAFFGVPNLDARLMFGASSFLEMSGDGRRLVYKEAGNVIMAPNPF